MATFEAQVEALTGLAIDGSSSPTQTQLSGFIVDGVKDVIHRMIEAKPGELVRFTSTTNSTSSIAKVGGILSVMREHDSTSILRKCTKIDASDRYDASDSDSLLYRSKVNPGYYELAGLIHAVPTAGSGNNDIVVTQLYYDTGVAYGDEVPDNFPESYAYLVAKYAAIYSLKNKMGATIISITAVPPDVPSLSAQSISITGTAPTYTAPTTTISGVAWATEYPTQASAITTALTAINTNIDSAVAEIAESATQVDAGIDTALAAMATAAGRINTAVALANDEFDEVSTQQSGSKTSPIDDASTEFDESKNLSKAYNSGEVYDALGAMKTELDKVDNIVDTAHTQVGNFYTSIGDIDNTTEVWDDTNKRFKVIKAALDYAGDLIDNNKPHANYDAAATFSDIDNAFSAMDAHLADGETVLGANPASGAIITALDEIKANILLANAEIDAFPVPPDTTSISAQSITLSGTAPTYTAPSIDASSDQITEMEAGTIGSSETDTEKWFDIVGQYIEDQEDSELAGAQIQKISTYLTAYGQAMQNQLNIFNDTNVEYQANIQKDIQNAQLADGHEARKLQRYSAEVAGYQADVTGAVQKAQGYINTAQAYASEVQARLSYADAYQKASAARGAEGGARINQLNATVSVAAQELQRANVAIAEINTIMASYRLEIEGVAPYLQTAQHYINQANGYAQQVQTYAAVGQTFISTGSAYLQEASSTIAAGSAYLQEAASSAQEVQAYGNEVSARIAQVGGYSQVASTYISAAQGFAAEVQSRLSSVAPKVSEFQAKAQDALNVFNDANVEYQATLQKNIQDAQLSDGNEARKLQKFQAEVAEYQAEVNTEVQEQTTKMQQYQLLHDKLLAEYDQAFMIAAPKQQGG